MNLYPTEAQLHASVADLLDWGLYEPTVYTTFPAGWGELCKATAGRLKGSGLKRGFPDLLLFHDGRCVGIELKTKNRKPSAAQQFMFARLRLCGMKIYVCQNADEVIDALADAKIPFRTRCGWAHFKLKDPAHEASDESTEARSPTELT